MEQLETELLEELKTELDVTTESDIAVLTSKIKGAIRSVKLARNYKNRFSDLWVSNDLNNYYQNIHDLAAYNYVTIGGEFQSSHNENGINRSWREPKDCLAGIIPIAELP